MRLSQLTWIALGVTSAVSSPLAQPQDDPSGATDNEPTDKHPVPLHIWGAGLLAVGGTGAMGYLGGRQSMKPTIKKMKEKHGNEIGSIQLAHNEKLATMEADLARAYGVIGSEGSVRLLNQINKLQKEVARLRQQGSDISPDQIYTTVDGTSMTLQEFYEYLVDSAQCAGYRNGVLRYTPEAEWAAVVKHLDEKYPGKIDPTGVTGSMLHYLLEEECKEAHMAWFRNGKGNLVAPDQVWRNAQRAADELFDKKTLPENANPDTTMGFKKGVVNDQQRRKTSAANRNLDPTMGFKMGDAKKFLANTPQALSQWGTDVQKNAPAAIRAGVIGAAQKGAMGLQTAKIRAR
ncbi:MAG: hypothetical protein M1823_004704 [Watsoniomyces obsoletus]|nr:MAG: hypothetical protein M1823_004704 [Watsoniomyces obsoletus]